MLTLYITLGIIAGFILILFALAAIIHHVTFGKRFDPDGIVKYYGLEDYPKLLNEIVEIPTKKGNLRGKLYLYPQEKYKGILVFSHGMWGSHRAYLQEMEILARNGFKVLGIDNYGTELSDGKNIKGLGSSLLTLNQVITYVKRIYPHEKIYVMGHSWGGFAAVNIGKYHKDIDAIVAMSPFISISRILKHQLPKIFYPTIPFLVLLDAIHCGKYSFANAKSTLKKSSIHTLVIHSKDDQMVPYNRATGHLKKHIQKSNIFYFIVDGKNHNPDYTLEALSYTQSISAKMKSIETEAERLEYRKKLDYHKMGEIDEKVFDVILDFLKK
ncbi:MAG: lysophospholipase [Roseburia sp.]|nr:lysophospholipase [Anaeroplasma bactoclasticum]MCM1196855.1 lysophospholipase [Roseburia sp.]MCM1557024.1 lysophospholipase [Anaeroplasma bactoclasticum]